MSLRHITALAVKVLSQMGWMSALFVSPPPFDPEPDAPEAPRTTAAAPERMRPRLCRESISGAPLTPVERELWTDLLGR